MKIGAILRGVLMAILLILCAALVYIMVIMGDTPTAETGTLVWRLLP